MKDKKLIVTSIKNRKTFLYQHVVLLVKIFVGFYLHAPQNYGQLFHTFIKV